MLGDPGSCSEVWFVLHGYRQLAERFIRRLTALPGVGGSRAVVAPEALSRFYIEDEVGPHGPGSRVGASWMTRADREHEIRDYVEYLDRVAAELIPTPPDPPAPGHEAPPAPTDLPRVVVLGFSQGAETASRWVTYGRIRPAELILWGGGLAEDLDAAAAAEALSGLRVRLVTGSDDRWAARRAEGSERRLRELGARVDRVRYEGGHVVASDVLETHWPRRA